MTANRIIQHIFQEPSLPQVSEAALEQMVTDYPYFTAARLLLAQKSYDRYLNLHAPAIKKAQLYSNNPHHFFQFVTGELEKSITPPVTSLINSAFTPTTYTPADPTPLANLELPEVERPAAIIPVDETIEVPSEIVAGTGITPGVADEIETVVDEWAEDPAAGIATPPPSEFESVVDEWGKPVELDTAPSPDAVVEEEWEEEEEEAPPTKPSDALWASTEQQQLDILAEAENDDTEAPAAATEAVAPETYASPAAENGPVHTAAAHMPASTEEEPLKIFPFERQEETGTTLTFQPLYTDDYFAYKKLKEPEQADDLNEKGAAEMRSFTDWLREMKQGFAQKANKDWYHEQMTRSYTDADPEVSETVEKMAMESITLNEDIVSETLAEIWARQRQYQTAIQIYQKLSLLNPNKSTYFAQKIQELQLQQMEPGSNKN
jgi:tetratricopeptide (TPR) repeat protein